MTKTHKFARSFAGASAALILVAGSSFAHGAVFDPLADPLGAPAAGDVAEFEQGDHQDTGDTVAEFQQGDHQDEAAGAGDGQDATDAAADATEVKAAGPSEVKKADKVESKKAMDPKKSKPSGVAKDSQKGDQGANDDATEGADAGANDSHDGSNTGSGNSHDGSGGGQHDD